MLHRKAPARIGIIGGGLAGLSIGCLLAERGHHITIYERDLLGGKLRRLMVGGISFDTGPSLFTFPEVWHTLLTQLGESDPLDLRPLPGGLGLHHTPYGPVNLPVLPHETALYPAWVRYQKAVGPLRPHLLTLLTTPPRLTDPAFVRASRALFGVASRHTAAHWLHLQQLPPALHHALATQALNAGLPPQQAPALYALLPGLMDAVYRPAAGMGAVLDALCRFAEARQVKLLEQTAVTALDASRGQLQVREGCHTHWHTHDLLISAIDPHRLNQLRGRSTPSLLARRTVAGVALYATLPNLPDLPDLPGSSPTLPTVPILPTTTVLTPDDFQTFWQSIQAGQLPHSTLSLLHAEGRNLSALLTVPALTRQMDSAHPWVQQQLQQMAQRTGQPELWHGATFGSLDPLHYAAGGHPGGAIYGGFAARWRSGPLHPQPYRLSQKLWQVGTGVHPGGGLPAIFGGALMVSKLLSHSLAESLFTVKKH